MSKYDKQTERIRLMEDDSEGAQLSHIARALYAIAEEMNISNQQKEVSRNAKTNS